MFTPSGPEKEEPASQTAGMGFGNGGGVALCHNAHVHSCAGVADAMYVLLWVMCACMSGGQGSGGLESQHSQAAAAGHSTCWHRCAATPDATCHGRHACQCDSPQPSVVVLSGDLVAAGLGSQGVLAAVGGHTHCSVDIMHKHSPVTTSANLMVSSCSSLA